MKKGINRITINLVSPVTIILFLAFFIAKIFDKIDWSWWWVFSPLWIPFAIMIAITILWMLTYSILTLIDMIWYKWK